MSASPVRVPALPPVATDNIALQRWIAAVNERLELREGTRAGMDERVVLQRDLKALGLDSAKFGAGGLTGPAGSNAGYVLVQTPGGSFTRVPMDSFSDELRKTRLYRDLLAKIDDAARFDDVPDQIRAMLLASIADEAEQRGADIRRMDTKLQTVSESLAYSVQEITAAVNDAAAGVRHVTFASATANGATAGDITQIQARLNNFVDGTPGVATIEQKMTASASRADGLSAQYTLKVGTGNKIAGIGLASTTNTAGAGTSAIILQADKFALVGSSETIADPANPPLARVPFGYDSLTNTIYINGQVRINAGGQTIDTMAQPGPPGASGTRGSRTVYATGTPWATTGGSYPSSDAVAAAAILSATGSALLVIGDTATITNAGQTASATRYWSGSGWLSPGVTIDGNLLVGGVISSTAINTSQYVKADGYLDVGGLQAAGQFGSSGSVQHGAIGVGTTAGLLGSTTTSGGSGVMGQAGAFGGSYGVRALGYGTATALYAHHYAGGTALYVYGNATFTNGTATFSLAQATRVTITGTGAPPLIVNSSDVCVNLNAQLWNGLSWSNPVGAGANAVSLSNKPGSTGGACSWLPIVSGGVTYYLPVWAV